MKFLVLCVLTATCLVSAVPLKKDTLQEKESRVAIDIEGESSKRDKRSHLGAASYGSANSYAASSSYNAGGYQAQAAPAFVGAPCGAAPIAIAPVSPYGAGIGAHGGGGYGYAPQVPAYGAGPIGAPIGGPIGGYPHYRADDYDEEMRFADMPPGMEHMPFARSYGYDAIPAASQIVSAGGIGGGIAGAAYGPAVGVFPNANVGGCAVPLLLSCSPSVQAGRIVRTQQAHSGYGAPSGYGPIAVAAASPVAVAAVGGGGYRDVDDHEVMQTSHREEQHLDEQHSAAAARDTITSAHEKSQIKK